MALCEGEGCGPLQHDIPRATVFQKPFTLSALVAVIAPALELDPSGDRGIRLRRQSVLRSGAAARPERV